MNRLGDLERAAMDVLWSCPSPATVREVAAALADRELAYTTVMTVLDRLSRKGFLDREPDGRAWRYHPVQSRDAYITGLMLDALHLAGDRNAALVHFAKSVPESEADALRRALRRTKR